MRYSMDTIDRRGSDLSNVYMENSIDSVVNIIAGIEAQLAQKRLSGHSEHEPRVEIWLTALVVS